jgi:hypothetical protein
VFSVISGPKLFDRIKEVLSGRNILYEAITGSRNVMSCLEEAARVNSSVLILDIDAGTEGDVVAGVKKFRVARPNTRIIVVAPGREPGDKAVAALVGKGVYDIVVPAERDGELDISSSLLKVLNSPPATYADAVRWDTVADGIGVEVKERVVYKERFLGMGYMITAGAKYGSGSTTMAAAAAQYLAAAEKKKVALIELCRFPVLERTADRFHGRVDVFPQNSLFVPSYKEEIERCFSEVSKKKKYDFIIADLGALYELDEKGLYKKHELFSETSRANAVIFTLGFSPWSYYNLLPYLKEKDKIKDWLVVTSGNEDTVDVLKRELNSENVFLCPFFNDPFEKNEKVFRFMEKLLSPLLPGRNRRKGLFGFLR